MRLVTFEEPHYHKNRIGLWVGNDNVVDVNYAYGRMLKDQGEDYPQRFADAFLPFDMIAFLEGGKKSMQAARDTLKFVEDSKEQVKGPNGEEAVFKFSEVKIRAPIPRPGKIIHTAGNFREHAKEGS